MFENRSLLKEYLSIDRCDELDTSRIIGEMRVVEKNSNDEAEIIKVIIDDGNTQKMYPIESFSSMQAISKEAQ